LSVCFSLVCVLKAQEHRRNAVFLFGQISLKSCLKTGATISLEVDKNGSWEGFEKIFSFFLNIF